MLIGVSGYSNSGKDTVGMIIQYLKCSNVGNVSIEEAIADYEDHEWWLEEQSGWSIRKFSFKLKLIASILTGIDIEKFEDQEFKKSYLDNQWSKHGLPVTVREFLQTLGTDCLRDKITNNIWVNALFSDYTKIEYDDDEQPEYPNWIITDVRFPNEVSRIKEKGGILIRITRPGVEPANKHDSEILLDNYEFDYKLVNNSDLFTLKDSVKQILQHAKIL